MIDTLRSRVERNIVLVSHGVFLETLLTRCSLAVLEDSLKARRFENAEMRSIVIGAWQHPPPPPPPPPA
jgi:broad specificity phosphatase PhoE